MIRQEIHAEDVRPGMTVLTADAAVPVMVSDVTIRHWHDLGETRVSLSHLTERYAPEAPVKVVTPRPGPIKVLWDGERARWVVEVESDGPLIVRLNGEELTQ